MLAACSGIVEPALPAGAVPMEPLPVYAEWWTMTEQCSARTADMSDIEWYVVPEASSFVSRGKNAQGMWSNGRIVIAGKAVREGRLVRHEMLHALLGRGGHPRADFVGRCGLLVSCLQECPDEGVAPPQAVGSITVTPSQLEMTVEMSPAEPSEAELDGYFRMAITVHNPLDKPVVVNLPLEFGIPIAFRYDQHQNVFGFGVGEQARFPEMTRFGPGETKLKIFDFWAVPSIGPPFVGTYAFRGGYGDKWSDTVYVTVTPASPIAVLGGATRR